jgi:hypothetical protein
MCNGTISTGRRDEVSALHRREPATVQGCVASAMSKLTTSPHQEHGRGSLANV